ncbi:unnamed protein product [Clavelina lepadiformis]|uniref:Small ribosomal subunit protein mS25 n=1 Tax=Clavelina lepadiformis TaxID=159417 RepID=A0ABP0GFL7_CLALP
MVLLAVQLLARRTIGFKRATDGAANPMRGLLRGKNPIVRTKQYLEQGIMLRDSIKIMMINFGNYESNKHLHDGARKFVELNFSQLQYKNPDVQILCMKDLTPTPFITFYTDDGDKFYIDLEGKSQIEILTHVQKIVGKPKELIEIQSKAVEPNPANFGREYKRKCICECQSQVECSSKNEVIPSNKKKNITGRTRNMNPKKYPFGKEEDD